MNDFDGNNVTDFEKAVHDSSSVNIPTSNKVTSILLRLIQFIVKIC
jgi:hypothetical protein